MSTQIQGYTGMNIDGVVTLQTGALTGLSLAADRTLTATEAVNGILAVSTGHATNSIIIPAAVAANLKDKLYIIANVDASLAANIKVAGGTAVTVAATKTAIVRISSAGTEVVRVTADA
jgi:hypothetical protein